MAAIRAVGAPTRSRPLGGRRSTPRQPSPRHSPGRRGVEERCATIVAILTSFFGIIFVDGRDATLRAAAAALPPPGPPHPGPHRISSIVLAPDASRFELHVGPNTCYLLEVRHTTRGRFRDGYHDPVFSTRSGG